MRHSEKRAVQYTLYELTACKVGVGDSVLVWREYHLATNLGDIENEESKLPQEVGRGNGIAIACGCPENENPARRRRY